MHRYTLVLEPDTDPELPAAALMSSGAIGLWVREVGARTELVAWFPAPSGRVPAGGRWETEPERDWLAEWRRGLRPVTVGRIRITPSWSVDEQPAHAPAAGTETIILDPGMAFGTGHHATTRLCLQSFQDTDLRARSVLDVGTGSGILAIVAARLGADPVVAVDTDPDAVAIARSNAERNDAAVDVRHGSLEAVSGRFDVVAANLTTETVIRLAGRLAATARRALIVSGIGTARVDEARSALETASGRTSAVRTEGEWAVITVAGTADPD